MLFRRTIITFAARHHKGMWNQTCVTHRIFKHDGHAIHVERLQFCIVYLIDYANVYATIEEKL